MGKLLDEVLAIHKSKINQDTSKHEIENNIIKINKKILERAENSESYLLIDFETVNAAWCIASSTNSYIYTMNESASAEYIINYLSEYYTNEGFEVTNGQVQMTISWVSKIM